MDNRTKLPPGQHEIEEFPRFGLSWFADRFPAETGGTALGVGGDVAHSLTLEAELRALPHVEQTADFHCVTTWSRRALTWGGVRFRDFYEKIVVPQARPQPEAHFVMLLCQDGYVTSLPVSDLLADNVLLADKLEGRPLSVEHGAPLRLVAPAHYGYKSAKHLCGIEFWRDDRHYRSASFWMMDHPRARVALEERGQGVPGWLLRYLYRPLVRPTIRRFRHALERYLIDGMEAGERRTTRSSVK